MWSHQSQRPRPLQPSWFGHWSQGPAALRRPPGGSQEWEGRAARTWTAGVAFGSVFLIFINPHVQTCTSAGLFRLWFPHLSVPGRSGCTASERHPPCGAAVADGRAGRGGARDVERGTRRSQVTSHGPGSASPPRPTAGGRQWTLASRRTASRAAGRACVCAPFGSSPVSLGLRRAPDLDPAQADTEASGGGGRGRSPAHSSV